MESNMQKAKPIEYYIERLSELQKRFEEVDIELKGYFDRDGVNGEEYLNLVKENKRLKSHIKNTKNKIGELKAINNAMQKAKLSEFGASHYLEIIKEIKKRMFTWDIRKQTKQKQNEIFVELVKKFNIPVEFVQDYEANLKRELFLTEDKLNKELIQTLHLTDEVHVKALEDLTANVVAAQTDRVLIENQKQNLLNK